MLVLPAPLTPTKIFSLSLKSISRCLKGRKLLSSILFILIGTTLKMYRFTFVSVNAMYFLTYSASNDTSQYPVFLDPTRCNIPISFNLPTFLLTVERSFPVNDASSSYKRVAVVCINPKICDCKSLKEALSVDVCPFIDLLASLFAFKGALPVTFCPFIL